MLRSTSPDTLPYGVNFSLHRQAVVLHCKSCATEHNGDGECAHETVAERTLIVTWVIDIFEVYEYAFTQYDPQTGQGGIFVDYVDTLLKLKTEAIGYPDWVRTP